MKYLVFIFLVLYLLFSPAVSAVMLEYLLSSPDVSVVIVKCTRIQKSYDICDTLTNVTLYDTVLGEGETFVQAWENAEFYCVGKEECTITDCRDFITDLAAKNHRVKCSCSYTLLDNQCGNVGQVDSLSVTVNYITEGIIGGNFFCDKKLKEHNIPDSASLFLHDRSILAIPVSIK